MCCPASSEQVARDGNLLGVAIELIVIGPGNSRLRLDRTSTREISVASVEPSPRRAALQAAVRMPPDRVSIETLRPYCSVTSQAHSHPSFPLPPIPAGQFTEVATPTFDLYSGETFDR